MPATGPQTESPRTANATLECVQHCGKGVTLRQRFGHHKPAVAATAVEPGRALRS